MKHLKPHLAFIFAVMLLLGACGPKTMTTIDPMSNLQPTGFKTQVHRWPTEDSRSLKFLDVYDPWEPMNRNLYEFNANVDEYVLIPATKAYRLVLPSPVRTGVSNVINNLHEVPVLVNCLLQGKLEKSFITISRILINTTFGVAGIWDQASKAKSLPRQQEDIGQTLGFWGVGNGPYFVMPVIGPSNLRDAAGYGGDTLLQYLEMQYIYRAIGVDDTTARSLTEQLVRGINLRANTPFRYHSTGSPFEYEMVRFIYTKKRELDIKR